MLSLVSSNNLCRKAPEIKKKRAGGGRDCVQNGRYEISLIVLDG